MDDEMLKIDYGNYSLVSMNIYSDHEFSVENNSTSKFGIYFKNGGYVIDCGAIESIDIQHKILSMARPIVEKWLNREKYDYHFKFDRIVLRKNTTQELKILTFTRSENSIQLKFEADGFSPQEIEELTKVWEEIQRETGDYYVWVILPVKSKLKGCIQVMNNRHVYYRSIEEANKQCEFSRDPQSHHEYEVRSL